MREGKGAQFDPCIVDMFWDNVEIFADAVNNFNKKLVNTPSVKSKSKNRFLVV